MDLIVLQEIKANNHDFIALVKALKSENVISFKTNASNIETVYYFNNETTLNEPKADFVFEISKEVNANEVIRVTKLHQQGKLDFMAWLQKITENGVAFWNVDLITNTCTYYSSENELIFTEQILFG